MMQSTMRERFGRRAASAGSRLRSLLTFTLLLLAVQVAPAQAATGAGSNTLAPNTSLVGSSSQSLQSSNGEYRLVMQGDGNLVIYGPGAALWATGTNGGSDRTLAMQGDGNLVIYNGAGQALWNTATGGTPGTSLALQDDGNLVLYAPGGAIWSRITGPIGAGGPNGPYNFANSAIADRAESYPNGAYGDQCLVFVTNMIRAAGGPAFGFGYNTGTYQSQWAQQAVPIGSLADSRRGDIVQWGGGAGGSQLHTAIITTGGANAQVIDSNWGYTQRVGRGSFASRNPSGTVYRIWRVGQL